MDLVPVEELSPFPIKDLEATAPPSDGAFLPLNNFCRKKFESGVCQPFYDELRTKPEGFYPCPFGFSCYKFEVGANRFAISGFVPFPRQNTILEAQRAKDHPQTKIARDAVERGVWALQRGQKRFDAFYTQQMGKYPAAFHEIIKLNGAVKQHAEMLAERLPENEHVKTIFSSAELMSRQFEILELIANQSLTQLPLKSRITLQPLVYKCLKIYESRAAQRGIKFDRHLEDGDLWVCNKTFFIIPTVLIDNAIRYSRPNSTIIARVINRNGTGEFSVLNHCDTVVDASRLFKRGQRGVTKTEGSGHGLFLAQLVAQQHHTTIKFSQATNKDVTFSVQFKLAPPDPYRAD